MAEKELRKLNRRELLQMLLVQCEESERLQQELDELTERFEVMSESYGRLKKKLDVKDERLNQKDARIAELGTELERLRAELEGAKNAGAEGSAAAAADRIGEIFRRAQREAEACLEGIRRTEAAAPERGRTGTEAKGEKKRLPADLRRIAGIRKKQNETRSRQPETEFASLDIAAGGFYG